MNISHIWTDAEDSVFNGHYLENTDDGRLVRRRENSLIERLPNILFILIIAFLIIGFSSIPLISQFSEALFNISFGIIMLLTFAVTAIADWYIQYKNKQALDFINEPMVAPHRVIDDYVDWEINDTIKVDGFSGQYIGTTKDMKIALREYGNDTILLPANYFIHHYKRNSTLETRKNRRLREKVEKEHKESEYTEFMKEFEKAYHEQRGDQIGEELQQTNIGRRKHNEKHHS